MLPKLEVAQFELVRSKLVLYGTHLRLQSVFWYNESYKRLGLDV